MISELSWHVRINNIGATEVQFFSMRSDPAIVQCIRGVRLVSKSIIISKAVMMINVVAA